MDSAYMINKPNFSIDEDLHDFFLYDNEVEQQKTEVKQRLTQFKERSKKMLKKHNWQRYFPNMPVETKKASLFERHLNAHDNEPIFTDDDSSFISTIEYSFLMVDEPKKVPTTKGNYYLNIISNYSINDVFVCYKTVKIE